jgi:hypothetical protein
MVSFHKGSTSFTPQALRMYTLWDHMDQKQIYANGYRLPPKRRVWWQGIYTNFNLIYLSSKLLIKNIKSQSLIFYSTTTMTYFILSKYIFHYTKSEISLWNIWQLLGMREKSMSFFGKLNKFQYFQFAENIHPPIHEGVNYRRPFVSI